MIQRWDPLQYQATAAFVPALGASVLARLNPQSGERILDLGCGDGALTVDIAATGAEVVGVDQSAEMVDAARVRGIDAQIMDATALTFSDEFDAVFSNAVLHWVTDTEAAMTGVAGALRPGGRFVAELGGHGNVAALCTALTSVLRPRGIAFADISPWTFPTVEEYGNHLARAGFMVDEIALIPRPTILAGEMADWFETFARGILEALPEVDRAPAVAEAVELVRPWLCDHHGRWTADYVRLRFVAHRPS